MRPFSIPKGMSHGSEHESAREYRPRASSAHLRRSESSDGLTQTGRCNGLTCSIASIYLTAWSADRVPQTDVTCRV